MRGFLKQAAGAVGAGFLRSFLQGLQQELMAGQEAEGRRIYWTPPPESEADPILLQHLDELDRLEYETDQRLQHG